MKSIIVYLIVTLGSTSAFAKYCSYNTFGKRLVCASDYKACVAQAKRLNGVDCKKESDTADLPPSLKESDPKSFCLWRYDKGEFKNMGCMAKATCEYSMRQYPQTVCVKGSVKDTNEIKKMYLANEDKVKAAAATNKKKALSKYNAIFENRNPKEIIQLVRSKYGRLELTSPEDVDGAQKRLEPFCANANAEACFVLFEMHALSEFKDKWNRSAEAQCNDLKKSNGYLNRSCLLGYNDACQQVISKYDLDMGVRSNNTFIREPGQSGIGNDEAKGIHCTIPRPPEEVYKMKEQCSSIEGSLQMCNYTPSPNTPDKMSYDELVSEGKRARDYKKNPEAISFFEKACEIKNASRACIDLALIVYETDAKKGPAIFQKACSQENLDKNMKIDCGNLFQHFHASP
ncbi:MAG: hypothetical protein AB7O96_02150 [Pseudobdellovibrionaceae bacterium]